MSAQHAEAELLQVWIQDFLQEDGLVFGGCGPTMRVLFGENVCENRRIGSRKEGDMCQKMCMCPPMEHMRFREIPFDQCAAWWRPETNGMGSFFFRQDQFEFY